MSKKDSRIKLLNEILNGIKVIKFYAWENPFKELVMKIRKGELNILRKYMILVSTAYSFTYNCGLFFVSVQPHSGSPKCSHLESVLISGVTGMKHSVLIY